MRSFAMALITALSILAPVAVAADWVGFRGSDASGTSGDTGLPTTWSASEGIAWKTELPGPGTSSPIVTGDKVLLTCYRGIDGDSTDNLERFLVCVDRASGKIVWSTPVKGAADEEIPNGMLMTHGYASSTPVTDGEKIYVLFGQSGVLAFDLSGNKLWQTELGDERSLMGWGSASSPVLYKNLVIVNAGAEAQAIIALDKESGNEVWKAPADGLNGCWATPVLVETPEGNQDLVLNAPYEIWGFNPDTGKLRWYCEGAQGSTVCPTVVAKDGIVYAIGGGGGMTEAALVAVKPGGKGDVNESHVVWRKNLGSYITSPVIVGDLLYWNANNILNCVKLADGETVYQERLSGGGPSASKGSGAGKSGQRRPGGGFGGGFGGGRGGPGGQPYASVVAADGKIYATMRNGEIVVVAAGPKFEVLARNKLDDDAGNFNATPAIDDGQLLVRSDKYLYCLGTK
jgi:hypothetical protein